MKRTGEPDATADTIRIGGRTLRLSNPDKVLYPRAGFTKRQVVEYYIAVAPYLLPHLKDRPVTLKRYPNGTRGHFFYEKDAPTFTPDWVRTFPVPRRGSGPDINYIVINDVATLAWCATLANLEVHPFLHRIPRIDRPTAVVFDLDPGEGTDVLGCGTVALLLREALTGTGLQAFPKVSGSKGLQLHVPLNTAVTYEGTGRFALAMAQGLERAHPRLVVTDMAKSRRVGRIFIDWSQNADYKTTVAVYSLRAKRDEPFVSLPVTWDELERAITAGNAKSLYFDPSRALQRLRDAGDLYRPALHLKQRLPEGANSAVTRAPASLAAYGAKRDFTKTREPASAVPRASRQGGRRRFVVQKHAAGHLRYDLRLEMHGVLKSWAVPKGVPEKHEERRLAMATEDHPIEYLDFEGTIPKRQYGGGTVMVWDIGTYDLIEGSYDKGDLEVSLKGKKLAGTWRLHRDDERTWSLVKVADQDGARRPRRRVAETSALTAPIDLSILPATAPAFMEPMRAQLVTTLPEGRKWSYEPKLDGYRALALKTRDRVQLLSRNENTLHRRFPGIAAALARLADDTAVDGELVALDAEGRPAFNRLQRGGKDTEVYYYVFDVLAYRGRSLVSRPLDERRKVLAAVMSGLAEPVRPTVTLDAKPAELIAAARRFGLEGIVAKRLDSRYEPGRASGAWQKVRVSPGQEFVIGGYVPGARSFDALLVGYYEASSLMFVAKIRNGFTPRAKAEIAARFAGLETDRCPFANLPEPKNARRGHALTAEAMKRCRWLEPRLVAQVEFAEWTPNEHLRHARYVGLRDDKDPRDVGRETARSSRRGSIS